MVRRGHRHRKDMEWGRRHSDGQAYPKTRGKDALPRGLAVVPGTRLSSHRKEMIDRDKVIADRCEDMRLELIQLRNIIGRWSGNTHTDEGEPLLSTRDAEIMRMFSTEWAGYDDFWEAYQSGDRDKMLEQLDKDINALALRDQDAIEMWGIADDDMFPPKVHEEHDTPTRGRSKRKRRGQKSRSKRHGPPRELFRDEPTRRDREELMDVEKSFHERSFAIGSSFAFNDSELAEEAASFITGAGYNARISDSKIGHDVEVESEARDVKTARVYRGER